MAEQKTEVIVVGAGLSGLACARAIQKAGGIAHLYEASDGVGGRVRTDNVEGFLLDRGFQVLFTAYPAIIAEIHLPSLHLKAFDPGAIILHEGKRYPLYDAFRVPSQMLNTMLSSLFGAEDKVRIARLRLHLMSQSVEQIFQMPDQSTADYLLEYGFSQEFLNRFARPFYGGIFLDKSLCTSARMFAFTFKMLSEGQTALPAEGMGAMAKQIAADLSPNTLHLNAKVTRLIKEGERVCGIVLSDGTEVRSDQVVLATEANVTAELSGLNIPRASLASTCLYFEVPEAFYSEKLLLLFADPTALVNNATLLTNVAPSYAPTGKHLLSATVLGNPNLSDTELAEQVKSEISAAYPNANTEAWRLLRVYRVAWSQFAQPAGVWESLPETRTPIEGLILAGEITVSSSLHGALFAGQKAAQIALNP
jgi:phytoene dehydrogenase-like protein